MKKKIFILSAIFTFVIGYSQTTEDFETETDGSTTFMDNGQNFTITNGAGETNYDIETFAGGGWNGSSADNKFIDNSGAPTPTLGNGSSFSISTTNGTDIYVNNLYIFMSQINLNAASGFTLTIQGRKNNVLVYTITKSTGFSNTTTFTPNNGFTQINFTTEGGSNNSNTAIDELIFTTTANADYIALDGFNWEFAPSVTTPTIITTSASSIANTSATLAGNATADGGASITERGIVYSISNTNSNPLINGTGVTKDTNGTGTGVFSESISNLSAGTQYSFKAYAINSVGTSYGSVSTFTTTGKGWIGATNTDWATNTNWSPNVVPISSDNLVIPNVTNKPIITAGTNATANTITINASSSLTIKSGGNLTIEGDLIQNGTFSIASDFNSNGSLIVKGTHTGSGTVDYGRYLSTSGITARGWHLVSSPVNGKNITDFYGSLVTNGTKRGIGPYVNTNPTNTKWSYFTTNETPGFFTNGKGYTIKKAIAGTLTFNGFLNTTNINIQVDATGDNYNAIGNPFTSFINGGTFLDNVPAGRLTEKTIWFWDEAGNGGAGEYITSNIAAAYKIAPGQGFFVQALATGNVTFSETLQTHIGGNTFLKQENKPEIKLFLKDGTNTKVTDIFYIENKTTGFDDGYDSTMFDGFSNPFAIYTQLISDNEGKNLAIQTLPNSDFENMIIPVGVNAESGKEITFSLHATNFASDLSVFLEDRKTNTFIRLDVANSEYKVVLTESLSGIGRFYLHTSGRALSITDDFISTNICVYKLDNSTLRIAGLSQGNSSFKLVSILGKEVINTTFTSNGVFDISLPKLANGFYIIQLKTANGMLNKKIILE
jgi:hypothetical protein